jgi:hypothetical protein
MAPAESRSRQPIDKQDMSSFSHQQGILCMGAAAEVECGDSSLRCRMAGRAHRPVHHLQPNPTGSSS